MSKYVLNRSILQEFKDVPNDDDEKLLTDVNGYFKEIIRNL